ncbi:helix-turn-helix transcriptional regulator [Streptomyces albicerus]|uniref:helix-turn-helix transcriptional regulator n=1 Tax=Streptomyces albicerus TaxID=2569859 RepID=UPI00124B5012|nr:helix-turn-helix transcriptional regulator [Streptomyces albicerus]
MADRTGLAAFLRTRREALQPEDVGLPRGRRRRTGGLRREEVAALCDMSFDYYSQLEQPRGPHPSEQMLTAIASGLRLSLEERDHLFQLAGHALPRRARRGDHINPGMMRILDHLADDTPALVVNHLGEALKQTRLAVALLGDQTAYTGWARSAHYRWFTDPASRLVPLSDHPEQSRLLVADLYGAYTRDGGDSRAAELVDALCKASPEFAALWREHPVLGPYCAATRFQHPQVGTLELHCQTLIDPDQSQRLLVYTAVPGTESHTGLQLLSLLG